MPEIFKVEAVKVVATMVGTSKVAVETRVAINVTKLAVPDTRKFEAVTVVAPKVFTLVILKVPTSQFPDKGRVPSCKTET